MEKNDQSGILKIAVIGPESTGKSMLSEQLAGHYHTLWVPEFARSYCTALDRECTLEDEINMFHGQLASEERALAQLAARRDARPRVPLICDTTIVTVKVWCEYVFGFCPPEVEKEYRERSYDLYLLMDIDLPWQEDPLRNFPDKQSFFLEWYTRLMQEKNAVYAVVSGQGEARLRSAITAIDDFMRS